MTTHVVNRPSRSTRPLVDVAPITIAAAPTLPESRAGGSSLHMMLPVVGAMSSMTMMITLRRSPIMVGVGVLVMVAAALGGVAMVFGQRGQTLRTRRTQRERYLDYLEDSRVDLCESGRQRQAAAAQAHPPPSRLLAIARDPARLWERRRTDSDFLTLRLGTGDGRWRQIDVADDSTPLQPADPFMLAEARALAARCEVAHSVPIAPGLDRAGNVAIIGARADTLNVARALAVQLIAQHSPDDVSVAIVCGPSHAPDWGWLLWAPHVSSPVADGPIATLRTARDLAGLATLLSDDLSARSLRAAQGRRGLVDDESAVAGQRLVIFCDTAIDPDGTSDPQGTGHLPLGDDALDLARAGITVLHLLADRMAEPGDVRVRITVNADGEVAVEDLRSSHPSTGLTLSSPRTGYGIVDRVPVARAEALARQLAPVRLSTANLDEQAQLGTVDIPTLLGIPAGHMDLKSTWEPRSARDFLRVPIGVDDRGAAVLLDLKESAHLGMGPHGLCVGATGSGKSELLRSIIAGLAITHPPEDVSFVLVDYKGGAAFAPLAGLPHVSGLITNLIDDPSLIARVHASLAGEVVRRQLALKNAGDLADIAQYRAHRAAGRPDLPALPHLLIVIDEFAELVTAREEFIELLITIGRIGRSIGVHLLLASQRIESGKLRGLDTYLSYRLGLRTFSESESSVVLETPDAYHLPPLPGFGWLKVDTSVYTRFRAAYVSGPDLSDSGEPFGFPDPDSDRPTILRMPFYPGLARLNPEIMPAGDPIVPSRTLGRTLLDAVVEQLAASPIEPVAAIWLTPLAEQISLDQVTGPPIVHPDRGLQFPMRLGRLKVPLGLLDDPLHQQQNPWIVDLTVSGGHLAIVGGPQSGKSTLLRSLAVSLALTHTPTEIAIYALDFGGALGALRELPHVGGVASRNDPERLRRTLEELRITLDHRERVFRDRGFDSVEQLRNAHSAGQVTELPTADVILFIDNAGALRADFEYLDGAVSELIARGPSYGIHVVMAVNRWNEVRMTTQPSFGTRIELRLNDPGDSLTSRRLAAVIRPDQRGRALTQQGLFAQTALPLVEVSLRLDVSLRLEGQTRAFSQPGDSDLTAALRRIGVAAASAWPGRRVPGVRVLPAQVWPDELPDEMDEPDQIPLGLSETTLAPALLDLLGRDNHLIVLGDNGCGKTSLLRGLANSLVARRSEKEVVLAIVDPRAGLGDAVPPDYLGGYAGNAPQAAALIDAIAAQLATRSEGQDRRRSTFVAGSNDPDIVIFVDDYEQLTAAGAQPLSALLPYLPAARDLGLHVVLARPVAGAARGMWDPVIQSLRDSGAVGLVMKGDRSEGQLFPGVHAAAQPTGRGLLVRRGEAAELIQTAMPAQRGMAAQTGMPAQDATRRDGVQ